MLPSILGISFRVYFSSNGNSAIALSSSTEIDKAFDNFSSVVIGALDLLYGLNLSINIPFKFKVTYGLPILKGGTAEMLTSTIVSNSLCYLSTVRNVVGYGTIVVDDGGASLIGP
ncbi:hypothetical protein BT08F37_45280 [Escherichia coli]